MYWWALLSLLLLAAAFAVRRSTGVPWSRIVYSDTRAWQQVQEPLYARQYGLVGKPDYLVKRGKQVIPVEVKPGRRAATPYPSDLMQLAAYCLLVEETTGVRPPFGLLCYADATFKVPFDKRRRHDLIAIVHEMQAADSWRAPARSHNEISRCEACGFASQCSEALHGHTRSSYT